MDIIDRKEGWGHTKGTQSYSKDDGDLNTDISHIQAHSETITEKRARESSGIVRITSQDESVVITNPDGSTTDLATQIGDGSKVLSLYCHGSETDCPIGLELNLPLTVVTENSDPALLNIATGLGGPNFRMAVNGAVVACNPLLFFAPQLTGLYVFKWTDPFSGESNIPLHCVNVGEGQMTWVSGFLAVANTDDLALPKIKLLSGPGPLRLAADGAYLYLSVT